MENVSTMSRPPPCWCDARCRAAFGFDFGINYACYCVFHGSPDCGVARWHCGSPETREDVYRVAAEMNASGQGIQGLTAEQWALQALDRLDHRGCQEACCNDDAP